MQQKLMNVRVRCVAADSIYANNANKKSSVKNMGYPHPLCAKGRAAKDEPLRKVLRSELGQKRGHPGLKGSFGTQKAHITRSQE